MSLEASGMLGGIISYGSVNGQAYAKIPVQAIQPDSYSQIAARQQFKFLSEVWSTLDPTIQKLWEPGTSRRTRPFNNFMKFNLDHLQVNEGPFDRPSPTPISIPSAPTLSGTAGNEIIHITITPGSTPPNWGYILFSFPFAGMGSDPKSIYYIIDNVGPVSFDLYGLMAVTRYYRCLGFHDTGQRSTLSNSKPLTPS